MFACSFYALVCFHTSFGLPEDDFKVISEFASSNFGTLGGYAQQYLFYYMREMGNKKL